jgi:methyl-accepting chemotaxis protein
VATYGDEVQDNLAAALLARAEKQTLMLGLQGALSLAGALLLAYFATAFYVSFLGAVRRLSKGITAMAEGDLSHKSDMQGRDEMAHRGQVVERMSERLSTMVAEIRSSAVRVSDTGQQLAGGSAALAERTETQASSLRQFVRTVSQLSTAVAGNAAEVTVLDAVTAKVHTQAAEGNQALQAVVGSVGQVSEKLRTIAHSSNEQSQGLREMAAAVGNLAEITRQNAALVDESRASSAALVDRDLYIFFVDSQSRYVPHGAKPAMEGKRVHDAPGIDGDRFVRDAFATAAAGGGWIDYAIVNPVSGQVQAKASWVQQLDDGLVIGCDIYRHKAAAASSPTAAATAASPAPQSRSAGIGKAPSPARRAAVPA